MGTWAEGPFDNDGAADFLDELSASPSRVVTRALRTIAKASPKTYLDVDDGSAAWAACELVALSFGQGDVAALDDRILGTLERLKPNEKQRVLALSILDRLGDRKTSELAGLWAENGNAPELDGSNLDVALKDLAARLQAASAGARPLPKPVTGDVLVLPATTPDAADMIVVQVVAANEVAVFEGTFASDEAAMAQVKAGKARRVQAQVTSLHRRARLLGNLPLCKDLEGKKLYAHDTGALGSYMLSTAAGSGMKMVTYDEARTYDAAALHDEQALRDVAVGKKPIGRVKTPDEHEAEIRAHHATAWAASRAITTPGPFGDVAQVEAFLRWTDQFGVDNAIRRNHDESTGMQGYGRPSEHSERQSYVFVGLVALWRGALPKDAWPTALRDRLPARPAAARLATATVAARVLAAKIITRDAALRMIWDDAPDGGEELRSWVARLQAALGACK